MAQLNVVGPDDALVQLSLDAPEVVIGRDPLAQLRLKGAKISRRHARLYWVQGTLWLEDLNSANGVLVNDTRIGGPVPLPPQARIRIGDYTLSVAPDDAFAQPDAGATDAVGAAPGGDKVPPTMVWVGENHPVQGVRIEMHEGSFEVGRSTRFLLHLDDTSVSRQHARGTITRDGIILHDADSRNGTFVNDVRIEDHEVAIGDRIRFGNVRFVAEAAERMAFLPAGSADQPSAGAGEAAWPQNLGVPALHGPAFAQQASQTASQTADAPRALGYTSLVPQPANELSSPRSSITYRPIIAPAAHPEGAAAAAWGPWAKWALVVGCVGFLALGALAIRHGLDRRAQHQYETQMTQGLTLGDNQLQLGAWNKAITAYEAVLLRDPLNQAASRGRHQAELHLDVEQVLGTLPESESPLYLSTLWIRLSPLLADPEAASLGRRPKVQLSAAQAALANICAEHADTACRSQFWPRCRDQAVCAVVFDADNMQGQALLDQAVEQVLRPPLGQGAPAEAVRRRAALAQRYTQARVRAAVLAYSTGDLAGALKALRQRGGGAEAQTALSTLWSLERAQKAGEAALAKGNSAQAIRSFEEAVALDARLLPPGQPSVVGRALLERACSQWLQEGERGFNRGRYAEALAAWQRGLQLDPNHRGILRAVDKLEARAKQLFDGAARTARITDATCRQMREVQSMVRRERPLYQATVDKMAACPTHTPQ